MSSFPFSKYEGTGNDFILIDDRSLFFDPKKVPALCHRKFGIGADGVILLQPSDKADYRMRIFNCDGTEAESCGNGLRCLGRFILDLGNPKKEYEIEVCDRIVQLAYSGSLIAVSMGTAQNLTCHLASERGPVHYVDTGVPHAVIFVDRVDLVPVAELGPFFRHSPLFGSRGANANFAQIYDHRSIHVRTFERGVEGETLACGTGACAVAAVARDLYGFEGPIAIIFPGGTLEISFRGDEIMMAGPSNRIFSGNLF